MSDDTLATLVQESTFIFAGSVVSRGVSSVKTVPAAADLAVATFRRAFRVNPMLGDLGGRPITVRLAPGASVLRGEQLIFFANSWVHGEEIAVIEAAHIPDDAAAEREVDDLVASLPARHLAERVASALLVVEGTVRAVDSAGIWEPVTEHAADWRQAWITVTAVLKGSLPPPRIPGSVALADGSVVLLFPESNDPRWRPWPKVTPGQSGVFLLHTAERPLPLPRGALVAPDPSDVLPADTLQEVRNLLPGATT
jgi:hypothetical protein